MQVTLKIVGKANALAINAPVEEEPGPIRLRHCLAETRPASCRNREFESHHPLAVSRPSDSLQRCYKRDILRRQRKRRIHLVPNAASDRTMHLEKHADVRAIEQHSWARNLHIVVLALPLLLDGNRSRHNLPAAHGLPQSAEKHGLLRRGATHVCRAFELRPLRQ